MGTDILWEGSRLSGRENAARCITEAPDGASPFTGLLSAMSPLTLSQDAAQKPQSETPDEAS